jgi:hypothetical protein
MQTIKLGKTLYITNRTDIFGHHAKATGKHKPVKSKGAEKRLYPPSGASMSTADYVAVYEAMNERRCIGSWDWQPLSTNVTMAKGVDSAWEVADHDAD